MAATLIMDVASAQTGGAIRFRAEAIILLPFYNTPYEASANVLRLKSVVKGRNPA